MKKHLLVISLLSIMLFLSGCVEQNTHVKINADGSADVSQTLLLSKELSAMAEKQEKNAIEGMMDDINKEFSENKGYKGEVIEENGRQGIQISKHFESVEEVFDSELFTFKAVGDGEVENPWKVDVDKRFFATYVSIEADINYEDWLKGSAGMSDEEAKIMARMNDPFDFSYSLTIPVKAASQNADEVDNRTYTWNLDFEENTKIELKYHVLDMKNVAIVGGIGLVALLAVVSFLLRTMKQKRNR